MANDFSNVLPILQDEANVVGRELTGFIGASYKNISAARAGLNQTVNYPVVPAGSTASVTPAATPPAGSDITPTNGSMSMSNLKKYSWNWTGEQAEALQNGDKSQYADIVRQTMKQGIRALVNEIELALWMEAYKNSSRAYGTAATSPFNTASDMSDLANIRRILNDNGAPMDDRHLVLGSAGYANFLAKQPIAFKANEAGQRSTQANGFIPQLYGFDIRESYPITTHTAGTNNGSATTTNAGYAAGVKDINLASAGTGTILAGDVIPLASENASHKYVVTEGDTDVSDGGAISIGAPGLRVAIGASARAITTTATYTPNVALQRNGLHLVMRQPNDGNDGAADVATVQDEASGLVFQLARYGQYMQSSWELRVLYGVKAANPHLIATLIG
jgi:hypothetical protein